MSELPPRSCIEASHRPRPNQERYLLAERASRYSFFIGVWFILPAHLDPVRLQTAMRRALARHAAFCTVFPRTTDGKYRVEIRSKPDLTFHAREVPDLDEATVEAAAAPLTAKLKSFEHLADLHRMLLLTAPDGRQALVLAQHHAVSDGQSLDLLLAEIGKIYSDQDDLPPSTSYYDCVRPDKETDGDLVFWRETLGSVDVVPQMHRAHRSATDAHPVRMGRALNPEASAALTHAPEGTTVFSMLAAGFAAQVARQTGQKKVVFSIQSAGRHGLKDTCVLGPLSNALPIYIEVDPVETAASLATRLRVQIRKCLVHEALGYHRIQQATDVRPDFALNLYPDPEPVAFGDIVPGKRRFLTSESDYGVNLRWQRDAEGCLTADVYYDSNIIEPARAEAFLVRNIAITRIIAHNPERPLSETLEAGRIMKIPAVTPQPDKTPRRLAELFADTVRQHGADTALRYDGRATSYSDLSNEVERLAGRFYAAGLREGMTIAFVTDRTPAFIISMLACSRLGATFCALDSTYPPERLSLQARLLAPQAILLQDETSSDISTALSATGLRILRPDRDRTIPAAPVPAAPAPDEIAYFLFTSGTTGAPNLVGTRHAALPAFLRWQTTTFDVVAGEKTTLLSGLAHDPVLRDVFLPLTTGGTLTIPPLAALRDPRVLAKWLESEQPNIIHTTPPLGRLLWQAGDTGPCLPGTRLVLWGGDMLPGELVEAAASVNDGLVQINAYGATETPQVVLWHHCSVADRTFRTVPLGRPRDGIGVQIRSMDGGQGDVNEIGEIEIEMPDHVVRAKGGVDVPQAIGRIYPTGDLGYLRPDGAIQAIGRADDQVSIRGYRVELSEVAGSLSAQEGVDTSIVLIDRDPSGTQSLTGHVVATPGHTLDPVALRRRLGARIPPYMVPAKLLIHETMPLLPNGKIDRASLQALSIAAQAEDTIPAAAVPTSAGEVAVANVFMQTLGRPARDRQQSFIDMGADSLNAIQAMLRLEQIIPDLPEEWPHMTLADLGARVMIAESDAPLPRLQSLWRMVRPVRAELTVIFRALAILAVVALHYNAGSIGGGATIILFLLAGYSMARFQLPQALSEATPRPVLAPLVRIVAITVPVTLAILGMKALEHEPFQPAGLFFYTNFINFTDPAVSAGSTIWLWFIAAYVQILLIIAVALMIPQIRTALARWPGSTMLAAFLTAAIFKYALIGGADMSLLTKGVPPLSQWNYLPSTHLPTVLLGMVVFMARAGRVNRLLCSGLIIGYAASVSMVFEHNRPEIFAMLALAVLWVGNVPMARGLYVLSSAISQSSLYLYLLHEPLKSALHLVGIKLPPWPGLVLAVVFAIIFTWFWNRFLTAFFSHRGPNRPATPTG